jgi:hypothetical protein
MDSGAVRVPPGAPAEASAGKTPGPLRVKMKLDIVTAAACRIWVFQRRRRGGVVLSQIRILHFHEGERAGGAGPRP